MKVKIEKTFEGIKKNLIMNFMIFHFLTILNLIKNARNIFKKQNKKKTIYFFI